MSDLKEQRRNEMFKRWMSIGTLMIAIGSTMTGFADYYSNSGQKNGGFFMEGDYLLWQVKEDGLEYLKVASNIPVPTPTEPPFVFGPVGVVNERPHFNKWNSGFRIGVGFESECNNWYTSLNYTYFRNRSTGNFSGIPVDGFGFIVVPRGVFDPFAFGTALAFNANATWKLTYDIIDWELGTTTVLNRDFKVAPFVGLRAAFINQDFKNDLFLVSPGDVDPISLVLGSRFEAAKNNFQAGGLRTGLDVEWKWTDSLGLYAKASGSLLYGKFSINDAAAVVATDITVTDPPVVTTLVDLSASIRERYTRLKANLEGAIGIEYVFEDNLRVRLGYELIHWFDQNQLGGRIIANNTSASDLCIQGLQLSATFEF
jgi:hypothetical protein